MKCECCDKRLTKNDAVIGKKVKTIFCVNCSLYHKSIVMDSAQFRIARDNYVKMNSALRTKIHKLEKILENKENEP